MAKTAGVSSLQSGYAWPLVLFLLVSYVGYRLVQHVRQRFQHERFKKAHGCYGPSSVMATDYFGLTFMFRALSAHNNKRLLDFFNSLFRKHGRTFMFYTARRNVIFTDDPENIKALLATKFDDWENKTLRQEAFGSLLGDGIFTTDGAFWSHSRAMLRPTFEKSQITDLAQFEGHVNKLVARIPADGKTVDLQYLFHCLTIDSSTELLFGSSTDTLGEKDEEALDFVNHFEYAMVDGALRTRVGRLYKLWRHPKAEKAISESHKFVDKYVEQAMKIKNSTLGSIGEKKHRREDGKFVFLDELAKHEEVDSTRVRDECLNILLAGRDTTASLLSELWFVLAREPEVYKKLQAEVDELHGELPTYEQLRNMKYLKYCAQETLRLYPPVPMLPKLAIKDTILPHGGGKDGTEPLFCAKGTVASYNMYSMHREPSIFGQDSESFNPDRWLDPDLRPSWGFLPFGGGPRVCLGQQYALTETYYVTVRLMQSFRHIEARDSEPWREKLAVTLCSWNGVKVGMYVT
ncbi:hypothetical protein BAUCODRAFT_151181 [Baudoinia panamericana UAMH 10762]|uniref:Cytochrome P450 alkane hydroxylase n=1 Tax=Baudoinia panamericana (strain UAMH 10762) TaxID=717646 RepID=M2MMV6_BAUPA|nr:uncharacterized protein BAUCODRAFT_151181 [Baudoinia panamericana UAMH 10762]EMC92773.1 hypothetical protein BAUCODRAFT_151181 [Baudoinia panamericana UAMH 10762]